MTHGNLLRHVSLYLSDQNLSVEELRINMFEIEVVDNLDAVQLIRTDDDSIDLKHYKFLENYEVAHPYPIISKQKADMAKL